MGESSHRGAFVFGLILGAVGGALAALLMTPKSGQQIREQIKDQTGPMQERLSTVTSGMRERADDMIGASKEKVTQLTQRGQEATDQVVDATKSGASQADAGNTTARMTEAPVPPAAESVEHQEPATPGEA